MERKRKGISKTGKGRGSSKRQGEWASGTRARPAVKERATKRERASEGNPGKPEEGATGHSFYSLDRGLPAVPGDSGEFKECRSPFAMTIGMKGTTSNML